jgi:intein/homing endonuclease
MPDNCVRHFLRGCWDGDGSFHFDTSARSRQNLIASIVSGSRAFIEGIVQALSQAGIKKRAQWGYRRGKYVRVSDALTVHISRAGKNPSYSVKLTGRNAIAFGKLIYGSVPESMYLKRKFEVFHRALEQDSLSEVIPGPPTGENSPPTEQACPER